MNPGTTDEFPAFWKESNDNVYTYEADIYGNLSYGRFTFMHPNNNGSLTQTFKPYQWGLFRVDVSGFTFGGDESLKATLSLSAKKPGGGDSQINISDEVSVDKIDGMDAQNIRNRIHEIARYSGIDANRNYIHEGHATLSIFQNVDGQYNYPGKTDAHNDEGNWRELTITKDGSGKVTGATGIKNDWGNEVKGLYCIKHFDKYGRLAPGIYINGNGSIVGDGDHAYRIENSDGTQLIGWTSDLTGVHELEVEIGQIVELGPSVPGVNAQDNQDGGHHHWWTPTGDFNNKRPLKFTVNYDSEGDYILTYNNADKSQWSVAHYRIKVKAPKLAQEKTPEADHVNFSNNRPVIIEKDNTGVGDGQDGSIAFTITEGMDNAGYATKHIRMLCLNKMCTILSVLLVSSSITIRILKSMRNPYSSM